MNDAARPPSSGAQILAEQVAEAMYARDRALQALGMKIVEVRPGYARMTMAMD
jgi:acyl-CoA thioesterase